MYDEYMTRVYIADAKSEERTALRVLLLDLKMEVAGEAADWVTTLAQAPVSRTDMLLIDWDLLPNSPTAALDEIRRACPAALVIVLISHLDARRQAALSAGADYFVSKGEMPDRVSECLRSAADYLTENLTEIRHTSVRCRLTEEIPEAAFPQPEETEVVVSSPRLDSLISAAFKLSRTESAVLIERELVLINGAAVLKTDYHPEEGVIVSVRGKGRFIFAGIRNETKKGRLRAVIKLYK